MSTTSIDCLRALPLVACIVACLCSVTSCRTDGAAHDESPAARNPSDDSRDVSSPRRMLALGDSYTIGERVPEEDGWPAQLVDVLQAPDSAPIATPVIIARTGWTTADLSQAVAQASAEGDLTPPYDLVTLMIGVNDQFQGKSIDGFEARYDALMTTSIALAGDDAARVLAISIPDWGASPFGQRRDPSAIAVEINVFNLAARTIAERHGVAWVDVTATSRAVAGDDAMFAEDGLHPSAAQYSEWVTEIAPSARSRLVGPGR